MYKVFFNDRKITIADQKNITFIKSPALIENIKTKKELKRWFLQFSENNEPEIILLTNNVEKFWSETFLPAFKLIEAAGGVVFSKGKLLVIYRNGKWDLPKGKLDKLEPKEKAALREVQEECGITGHSITRELTPTFHIYKSPYKDSFGQWILKKTHWYEMQYSGNFQGNPQLEEDITEIQWLSKSEIEMVLLNTYESLKSVFLSYLD